MTSTVNIEPKATVASVVGAHPELQEVFVRHGFTNIVNPIMRATVAKKITLQMACSMKGVDLDAFIADLKAHVESTQQEEQ